MRSIGLSHVLASVVPLAKHVKAEGVFCWVRSVHQAHVKEAIENMAKKDTGRQNFLTCMALCGILLPVFPV